ncbi:hypothetical protein SBI_05245 [Streptomyces bingchenggensis BCW-1]|uniref:DUF4352 domain-containing protein n=2 Tax=Streptomyces TaxID=1883 RepID=D7C6X8_STRBB|nr:hypothetical protein SBI_05245 [Streptomyces bingchenggensis BCW-1]
MMGAQHNEGLAYPARHNDISSDELRRFQLNGDRFMRIRSTRNRTAVAVLCAAGFALVATGCNDNLAQDGGSTEAPSKAPKKPSASASKAVDSDAGKTLALGESTPITYKRSDKTGTLRIAAKSVVKGAQSDLDKVALNAEERKLQPYYVTMSFENIGKNSIHYPFLNTPTHLRDSRGEEAKSLITLGGDVTKCPGEDPDDFNANDTATLCKVFLLPSGETPSVVSYTGDFDKEPVFWRAKED